jgi:hypothetical protein
MAQEFQNIRFTLNAAAKVRYSKLEGKDYAVVPTVMLVEGVHYGNMGPLFYRGSTIGRNTENWNHKPVVNYHPEIAGKKVSAANPAILEKQRTGFVLNTQYKAKLKTESWLDIAKCEIVDVRIMEHVRNGTPMEVSTGLSYTPDNKVGVWNGEEYSSEVIEIVPDHLALLPDQTGACSLKDGAGLLVNVADDFPPQLSLDFNAKIKEQLSALRLMVQNEMSNDDLFSALLRTVRASLETFGISWDGYIVDVFPKFVVYSSRGTLYKVAYKASDMQATLSGDPVVVVRKYSYVTENGFSVNVAGDPIPELQKEEIKMATNQFDPKPIVDGLILANAFPEGDREFLMTQPKDRLDRFVEMVANKKVPVANTVLKEVVITPQQKKSNDVAAYLSNSDMPQEMKALISNALVQQESQKTKLVDAILAVPTNRFQKEYLVTADVQVLEGMLELATNSQQSHQSNGGGSFFGANTGPSILTPKKQQAANSANDDFLEILETP